MKKKKMKTKDRRTHTWQQRLDYSSVYHLAKRLILHTKGLLKLNESYEVFAFDDQFFKH